MGRRLGQDAKGQSLGHFEEDRIIEQVQGLKRRVGTAPAALGHVPFLQVEVREERVWRRALEVNVDTPPIPVAAGAFGPLDGTPVAQVSDTLGLVWTHAGTAHLGVQQSGNRKCRVTQRLGGQAQANLPGEKPVRGVLVAQVVPRDRRLPVGRGGRDQAVDVLHPPTRVDELRRQPVQQLRMRRGFAPQAEVVGSRDEARAEVFLPDPVDRDAGSQRIIPRYEPAGQVQAVGLRARGLDRGQDGRGCGCHLLRRLVPLAVRMDVRLPATGVGLDRTGPANVGKPVDESVDLLDGILESGRLVVLL